MAEKTDDSFGSLPEGFKDKRQSCHNLDVLTGGRLKREIVGQPGCMGLRIKLGFIYFEIYASEQEPKISVFNHPRLICWQPLTKLERPTGWWPDLFYSPSQYGVVLLKDENYWQDWSNHAKRHRKKWRQNNDCEIIETNLESFTEEYNKTKTKKVGKFLKAAFINGLKLQTKKHPEDVFLYAARRKEDKKIIAGLAVIIYPDVFQSSHTISFINPSALKTSVGTGLIDHWYRESLKRGARFLNFGLIWKKGDPSGWKGYSKFKRQFNPCLLYYRRQFIKFVRASK